MFDFGSQLRPPGTQKSSPRGRESMIFEKSLLEVDIDFVSHFYPNLAPFWLQKSTKNSMGELPERFLEPTIFPIPLLEASGLIFDGFLVDFGWIFNGFFMIF